MEHDNIRKWLHSILYGGILILLLFPYCESTCLRNNVNKSTTIFFTGFSFLKRFWTTKGMQDAISTCCIATELVFALWAFISNLFSGKYKGSTNFLLGLGGVVLLIFFQMAVLVNFMTATNNNHEAIQCRFTWAYWLSVVLFTIAACVGFCSMSYTSTHTIASTPQLHINIISQTIDANNK